MIKDRAPQIEDAATRQATDQLADDPDGFTGRPTSTAGLANVAPFEDRPPAPQRLKGLSDRRRREFAADLATRTHGTRPRPAVGKLTVLDLGKHDCRFISGDDGLFCGRPKAFRSWRREHAQVVYRAPVLPLVTGCRG